MRRLAGGIIVICLALPVPAVASASYLNLHTVATASAARISHALTGWGRWTHVSCTADGEAAAAKRQPECQGTVSLADVNGQVVRGTTWGWLVDVYDNGAKFRVVGGLPHGARTGGLHFIGHA